MKKTILTCAVAAASLGPIVCSAQATAEPASPVTGNATIASDYRFRGISQTYRGPAIQGGLDYTHSSGLYLGNWNSNVSGLSYPNGAGIEMDFYGGYKKTFGDLTVDVGTLYYYYPDARFVSGGVDRKFDNWEFYVGASWKWLSFKASNSLTNYFGLDGTLAQGFFAHRDTGVALADRGNSKGTMYYDLSANYEVVPKLTLNLHVGYTDVKSYNELDYIDYKVGLTYDLKGWQLGAAVVGTDANKGWYYARDSGGKTKSTGTPSPVLSVGKTF
ncbi:MAG: TorF family putative porin [Burkholderiales bacterium]